MILSDGIILSPGVLPVYVVRRADVAFSMKAIMARASSSSSKMFIVSLFMGFDLPFCLSSSYCCGKIFRFIRCTNAAVWFSVRCVYFCVVWIVLCPRISLMSASVAPCSARQLAAECRRS